MFLIIKKTVFSVSQRIKYWLIAHCQIEVLGEIQSSMLSVISISVMICILTCFSLEEGIQVSYFRCS